MTVTARSESPLARVSAVARKEIVDIARDRRTMLVTLVTAIVAGPVLMLLVLNLIARQSDKVRELVLPVVGIERAPALQAFLERQQLTLKIEPELSHIRPFAFPTPRLAVRAQQILKTRDGVPNAIDPRHGFG